MLVSKELREVEKAVRELLSLGSAALDTETFGLSWDDRMFALILGTDKWQMYFNFYDGQDHLGGKAPHQHDLQHVYAVLSPLFSSQDMTWFMHNAKFDLRRLDLEGIQVGGKIHDTEVVDRILRNDHLTYGLDVVAERWGCTKDDAVEKYISEHSLYTWVDIPGKKKRDKHKHFEKVPFEIMHNYACKDVAAAYIVGRGQLNALGLP